MDNPIEAMAECCNECLFFSESQNGRDGGCCRRSPPVIVQHLSGGQVVAMFPPVDASNWCGEFAAIVEVDEGPQ